MKQLVSILVPVYNVEKYVERCLQSLVEQTYAPLEIILVNDGSKDGSGAICQRFAQKYTQIHYYCKENEGLSATRNFAIEHASGTYYLFVDSDDHIETDMVEKMVDAMEREQGDIVQCSYRMDYRFGISLYRRAPRYQIFDRVSALHQILRNREVNNFSWGKLYRASLFEDVRFPLIWKGFEDVCTTFKTFMRAKRIVTMPDRFYHYVQRKGSFMNREGLLALDMDMMQEMRQSFAYQEAVLQETFPKEAFSNQRNFFTTDILIIYTMIVFVPRKEGANYPLTRLDTKGLPLLYRFVYPIWLGVARLKFGRRNLVLVEPKSREEILAAFDAPLD